MTRSVSPPLPAPAPWPRLMLISCAAAGSAPRMIATTAAPVARRTQRPIADDVKLCCQDGPTNSPSPVRGCHKGKSVVAALPWLRDALRSVTVQGGSARPSVLARQPALAWVRGAARPWRRPGGATPPPADAPFRRDSDRPMQQKVLRRRAAAEVRAQPLALARALAHARLHALARVRQLRGSVRARRLRGSARA